MREGRSEEHAFTRVRLYFVLQTPPSRESLSSACAENPVCVRGHAETTELRYITSCDFTLVAFGVSKVDCRVSTQPRKRSIVTRRGLGTSTRLRAMYVEPRLLQASPAFYSYCTTLKRSVYARGTCSRPLANTNRHLKRDVYET